MVHLGVVNVDGAMYWLIEDEGTNYGMAVMSFDLKEETFTTIQLPPLEVKETGKKQSLVPTPRNAYYITEIDEKVCIVTIPYQRQGGAATMQSFLAGRTFGLLKVRLSTGGS